MTEHSISRTEVGPGTSPTSGPRTRPQPTPSTQLEQDAPPVYLVLLVDASGSMADDGKCDALDHAVTAVIERLSLSRTRRWHIAAVAFGPDDGAVVLSAMTEAARVLRWPRASGSGATPLGAALELAADLARPLEGQPISVVLFTDGFPTDDWRSGLDALTAAAPRARRIAVAIGEDADLEALKSFASLPVEHHVLRADEAIDVPALIEALGEWIPMRRDSHAYVPFQLAEPTS